jgi:hypothetical protein
MKAPPIKDRDFQHRRNNTYHTRLELEIIDGDRHPVYPSNILVPAAAGQFDQMHAGPTLTNNRPRQFLAPQSYGPQVRYNIQDRKTPLQNSIMTFTVEQRKACHSSKKPCSLPLRQSEIETPHTHHRRMQGPSFRSTMDSKERKTARCVVILELVTGHHTERQDRLVASWVMNIC